MSHELMEKYVGCSCVIYTLDNHTEGKIIGLEGNWLEVECGKKKENRVS